MMASRSTLGARLREVETHVQAVMPIRMHGQQQKMMLSRRAPVKLVFS